MPLRWVSWAMPPSEQIQSGRAYPSSDLYSLAVTAMVLLTGKEPQQLFDDHQPHLELAGLCHHQPRPGGCAEPGSELSPWGSVPIGERNGPGPGGNGPVPSRNASADGSFPGQDGSCGAAVPAHPGGPCSPISPGNGKSCPSPFRTRFDLGKPPGRYSAFLPSWPPWPPLGDGWWSAC